MNIAILQILNFVPVSTSEISLMADEWGGAQWRPSLKNLTKRHRIYTTVGEEKKIWHRAKAAKKDS